MKTEEIQMALTASYRSFTEYIGSLTTTAFHYWKDNKWSAQQQLDHLILSVSPLVKIFNMDTNVVAAKFGTTNNSPRSYDTIIDFYLKALANGAKAPDKFVPEVNLEIDRNVACTTLNNLVDNLCSSLTDISDENLDTVCIPHPLAKNFSMREMLYHAIYHAEHHHKSIVQMLK